MSPRRPLSDEGRLIILLTFLGPSETERAEISRLFTAPIDYARFDYLARVNAHRPWILYQMEALGHAERLREPYRSEWRAERDRLREKLERRFVRARPLFQRFAEEGIPVAVLKGIGLAHKIYRNPYYQNANGIDILVRPGDLPKIYAIYDELGFVPLDEPGTGHAIPYVSRDRSLVIGTRWGIKTLRGPYRVDYAAIWSRVEYLNLQGVGVKILAPEDALLHLCLHLGFFKTPLKDLIDVTNLLRHYRKTFPFDRFVDSAIGARAASHAYQALALSNRLYPMAELDRALVRLLPHAWTHYVRGVSKKAESVDDFLEMSVDWIQEVGIEMSLFRRAVGLRDKGWAFLRVLGTILIPPRGAVLRMNFDLRPSILREVLYRLITPPRIVRALAEEIGWKSVGLVSLKTLIDVFRKRTSVR